MRSLLSSATIYRAIFATIYATCGTLLLTAAPAFAQLHSPQVTLHRAEKPEDLSWVWSYAGAEHGGDESRLVRDARFKPMLARSLTAPQSFWGNGRPLAEVAEEFLSGGQGSVIADDNRYLSADACVRNFCADRGLLWMDLGLPQPLIVFAATDWISENKTVDQTDAAYTLWVFSNRALTIERVPPALRRSLARWTAEPLSGEQRLRNVTRVFVVDPDGTPHAVSPTTIGAHNTLPAETSSEMKGQP